MTPPRLPRFTGAALAVAAPVCLALRADGADDPAAAARLKHFNDLKVGTFVHWGPDSPASVEASWPIMTPRAGRIAENGNGEAICGTTYGPLQRLPFASTTAKDGTNHLHLFDWPAQGPLAEPGVSAGVRAVGLLAGSRLLEFSQQAGACTIQTAGVRSDLHATVLAIDRR